MRLRDVTRLSFLSFAALTLVIVAQAQRRPGYKPLVLPRGKFPASESMLLQMRDEQDIAKMRAHAWELFAGLTRSGDFGREVEPIWETWYTKCDVRLMDCPKAPLGDRSNQHRLIRGFQFPGQTVLEFQQSLNVGFAPAEGQAQRNFEVLPEGLLDQLLGELENPARFASVLYNYDAASHINQNNLNGADSLRTMLRRRTESASPMTEREIPPFPNTAVVLKLEWQLVHSDEENKQTTARLHVWNPAKQAAMKPGDSLADESGWGKDVLIDLNRRHMCRDKNYEQSGIVPTIPRDCFFMQQIDPDSVPWSLLPRLQKPHTKGTYYLVLMAVHVITKETPDWVWATFWWYTNSRERNYGCDRSCRLIVRKERWRHFLMNTTLSDKTPIEADGGPRICFNPYLEEVFPGGISSNCVQCHKRAVFAPADQGTETLKAYSLGLNRALNSANDPSKCGLSANVLQTDFMWSIAEAQDQNLKNLLRQLSSRLHALNSQ